MNRVILAFVIGILFLPEIVFGMTSTTTCKVLNLNLDGLNTAELLQSKDFTGTTDFGILGGDDLSAMVDVILGADYQCVTQSQNASNTPVYIQDSGNISFALAILIFLVSLMFVGFLFNSIKTKKPWY